jgi:hypothetical protein
LPFAWRDEGRSFGKRRTTGARIRMTGLLSPLISSFAADIIGLIGSAMMVVAYAYSNVAKQMNFIAFNLVNLVGSLLLITSLTVHFNIAAMAMEIVWTGIAIFGLAKSIAKRTRT